MSRAQPRPRGLAPMALPYGLWVILWPGGVLRPEGCPKAWGWSCSLTTELRRSLAESCWAGPNGPGPLETKFRDGLVRYLTRFSDPPSFLLVRQIRVTKVHLAQPPSPVLVRLLK